MVINSKPADRPFLDHDQVEDIWGNIYVVVGNLHPPSAVIAYLKYIPTSSPTYWRRGSTFYRRVIRNYGVRNVKNSVRSVQHIVRDPVLGSEVPIVKLSSISRVYSPEARLSEIIRRANDRLEIKVIEFIILLKECTSICTCNLGIDGSILPGIHNPDISDIDMVVYGCKESIDVIEGLPSTIERRIDAALLRRLERQSRIYGIPKEVLLKMQPPHRYIRVDGTEVNISFVDNRNERYGSRIYRPAALVEAKITLRGGECTALFYPSKASVDRVVDLRIIGSSKRIEQNLIKYVVSYEGIFSYLLYLGGNVLVKGVLEEVIPDGYYIILVGAYENPGYIIPSSKKLLHLS